MTDIFRPMKINVPGLLGDDALREQMKQFADEKNIEQAAAPLPSGAVEMADKVQRDFLSQPGSVLSMAAAVAPAPFSPLLQTAALGMRDAPAQPRDPVLAAQDTAIDVRSDIIAGAVDKLTPDFISEIGNMTDPERQAEADKRLEEAKADQALAADEMERRAKMRASPGFQDMIGDIGKPVGDMIKVESEAVQQVGRDKQAAKNTEEMAKQQANKELQPTQTWWMNAIQKGVASGYMTLTGALGGVAGGYELTVGRVFNGGDIRRSDMRAWINTVEATVNKTIPGDPLRAQEFLTQLAEGGGSFASYALGGLALRAAGLPAAAGTAGIGFFSGANTGLVDAERFNAVGVQKYMAYMLNGALGITEAWPINRMFMRAEAATGGLVSRLLNQTAAEGLEEFVQELGQSVGHDVVAKWVYDAQREFDASKYVKQAAVGGLTGGIAGGAAAVLSTSPAANPALRVDPKLKASLDALTPDKQTSLIDNTIAAAQAQLDAIVPDAPAVEQASVAPATSVFEGPGGAIPVREDGLMELSHWSSAPRDVIDPAMRGTGPLRGQEQNRIGRKSYGDDPNTDIVDRSYYGVGDPFFAEKFAVEQAGLPAKERRRLANTDPYHREGLGGVRHTVAVDPATIYNWYDDPLNLRAQLDKTTPASEQVTRYERLIKDAGFKGAYFSESDLGQTAILFDKATPEKITDDYYGLDPKEIATPDDFKQLKPETFAKGGWAVITGIQEAQGEHNSPANVEANKKLENVLKRNGIKYQVVSGAYKGVDQGKSFLIFAPEKVAKQLGERFKQESILTRKGLEYTDGRVTPVDPAGTIIGPEAAKQDFYSTLPDGTAFTMGLKFDATTNPEELAAQYATPKTAEATEPLEGLPKGSKGPIKRVVDAATAYAKSIGIPVRRQSAYVQVDKGRATRIAQAYEDMKHDPANPKVVAAYRAMIDETLAQYQFVKQSGLTVDVIQEGQPDPYTEGPKQVLDDLALGHLWLFPTDSGFGKEGDDVSGNPLLEPTEEFIGDRRLLANDVFRIVHDFFGHGIEGAGFGARGEENAWQSHMRLYSEAALPAVTSETRGQNSWVNFGPHGEANRANQRETVYAEQKTGLMPEWTWREGVEDDGADLLGMRTAGEDVTQTPEFKKWFGESKAVDKSGKPLVLYHGAATSKEIREFKIPEKGGFRDEAAWFTPSKRLATSYGMPNFEGSATAKPVGERSAHVLPVFLKMENPIKLYDDENADTVTFRAALKAARGEPGVTRIDIAKRLGHDSIITGQNEYLVFDPAQIKSVNNDGAFDPGNPDILAMVAKPDRVAKLVTQVAGLKGVIKHMAPDEQAKLKKSNAQAIVDIFSKLPDPKEMAAVAFSGRAKKGWYQRSAEALVDVFGLNDAPRFAALLAALSPQTSVENNATNALWMWVNWIKAGRPTEQARIVALLGQSVMGSKGADSVLPSWVNNTVTALTTEDPQATTLSGPKVNSFMLNLQGVVNEVTNDAWMANFANVDQTLFKKTGPAPGKGAGYTAMSAVVRKAAETATKLTGETWTPAEIQETVWSWAKTLYEKATSAGELRSAAEIIAVGGMTAEEISATPDFASLFVAGAYRTILEKGGYNVDNLEGRSRSADGGAERGGDPVSAEGSGFAQGAFDAHLRRAAKRLDALRERRAAQTDVETFSLEETFDMGLADQPGDTDPYAGFTADDIAFMESGGLFASRASPAGDVTQTPEFKAWFGDSKVVDERGKPLVVYHGTDKVFAAFDPEKVGSNFGDDKRGFFFTNNPSEDMASGYATMQGDRDGGNVMPVYLSLQKPYTLRDYLWSVGWSDEQLDGMTPVEISREALDGSGVVGWWDRNKRSLMPDIEAGAYDGVQISDYDMDVKGQPEMLLAAFEPTQIKSVNNAGGFDPAKPDILAMASPRAAYKGELTRPKKGVPMQPGDEGIDAAEAGIAKVGQNFVKLLGLTTRLGRFTLKGSDIMGQFSTKQAVVRLRSNKDVSTLVHEGGHAMQAAAAPPLEDFIKRNANALMKAAADMYGGDLSKADNKTKIAEGFAEFFRVYTLGRAYAVRKYPALTADFTDTLDSYAPELKTGLEAIGTQFEAWALKLPSAKVLESMVVTGRVDTGLNAALADLREAGFGTWMQEVTRTAVENSVNRNAGLNSLVSRMLNLAEDNKGAALDLKRANDPRVLVRLAGNAGARAMVQTTDGVMPYRSVEAKTRGLREALALSQGYGADANVGKIDPVRQKAFAAYVVSLRGIDEFRRKAEGKIRNNPLGDSVTLAELQQTVKDYEAAYGTDFTEAAAIMHEYGMALWQKAYDAGLMSKDAYLAGQDRQFYVPLQRDMTDLQANPGLGGARADGGRSIVKAFKGSGRDVIDPMDVLMHKTFSLEQAIAKNDIVKALASLADRAGQAGALVERIPASQMVAKGYSVEEIAKALTKDKDLSADDAQDLMDMLDASIAENNMLNLFRAEQAKTKGENILFFWEKGKVAAIQLIDGDLGADVVNLMNGVGPENFHFLVELVSSISGAFRSSITVWPDFLAVNFIRDQWNAYSLTDVGYIPFVTGLRGVGDELRQRSWAKQYNAAMGVMGGMNVASMHNAAVSRDINALRKRGYIAKAFNEGGFAGAVKGMASMVELTETGTRLGVFRKAFGRAKKDGLTDWEASIEASYLATDMMDFGLNGSRMALFRRTIPFLNAQVQGLYKLVRTLGGDEVRQRKGLAFVLKAYTKSVNNLDLSRAEKQAVNTGRKAWVKMASLAVLSAALHFIFEDDPDYQDASEYLRATGWVIPMGDGRVFYIPKPFELALLANFTERALESASGDTGAKARFLRGLAMNMTPPTSPPAIKVAVEEFMNKDSFAGRAIVPTDEIGMPPQMQYDEYTTDLAKRIGEATGLSPRRVDHVMSGLGASAYRDVSSMFNSLNPNRPTKDADETPFFRRFVRDARRGSATSRDFWKEAALTAGVYDGAANAYQKLLQSSPEGRAANEFLDTLDEDLKAYAVLDNHFPAGVKRFHPYYRGRQVAYIVSAMRRELISDIGLEDTTTKVGEPILLTASLKAKVDDELSEYARREMRNSMVTMKATGWADKAPMDLQGTIDMLEALDPRVSDELLRRMKAEKVVPSEMVQEYWPEVKNRLLTDGADANFIDVLTIAKAMQ